MQPPLQLNKLGHGEHLMEDDLPLDVWLVRRGLLSHHDGPVFCWIDREMGRPMWWVFRTQGPLLAAVPN